MVSVFLRVVNTHALLVHLLTFGRRTRIFFPHLVELGDADGVGRLGLGAGLGA